MNLILLGAPGSGKGTQAKVLAQKFKLAHISTGDLFREEIAKKTALGEKVGGYVTSGKLVPDGVVTEVLTAKLATLKDGFLLDGFPRTLDQAMALDQFLHKGGKKIAAVVYLNLSEDEVVKRLGARRNCSSCGELYNMVSKPPRSAQMCDKCGGRLVQREDDKEATIKKRMMVFRDLTEPLVSYYKTNEHFIEVDAAQAPEQVTETIGTELGSVGAPPAA